MNAEFEPKSVSSEEKSSRGNVRKIWFFAAAIALVAAFFFQWKNGVDQAAIAQPDSGGVVRAKIEMAETPRFRVFFSENFSAGKIDSPDVYDSDGNFLCKTERVAGTPTEEGELFSPVFSDDAARERFAKERFPRLVFFSIFEDGKPVVLVLKKSKNL